MFTDGEETVEGITTQYIWPLNTVQGIPGLVRRSFCFQGNGHERESTPVLKLDQLI